MAHPLHGAAPERIGDYKILKVLGAGSFAQVAVGQNEKTGDKVALKVINTGTWTEKNKQRRTTLLKREIRLCRLLHHPNIIRLLGTLQDGNNIVLMMEYQSGGDLEHYTYAQKAGYIPEAKARDFFRQIVSGVDYLHKNFMTHRDIKPANIILDKAHTTPKLIDFGFTNVFDEKEKMQSFLGSPHFAAPELLTGTKYKGPAVDIWSLGVTLYSILTGKLPFQAHTMEQLMEMIVAGNISYPSHVASTAQELIQGMLTTDMDTRISMDEVRESKWLNEGYHSPPPDLAIPRDQPVDKIDEQNFKALISYGFDDEAEVEKELKSAENSTIKAVYCLLLEARAREQQAKYIQEAKDHAAQHEHADKDNVGKRLSAAILQVPKDIKEALSPMMKRRGSATSARKESKPDAGEQPHE